MMKTTTLNAKLQKILNDRPLILDTLLAETELDDELLLLYQRFMNWYNGLSLLDKDIYYLTRLYSVADVAKLMDISYSFIYSRKRKLIFK